MIKKIGLGFSYFVPFFAFAQGGTTIQDILLTVGDIFDIVIPFLITLALVYFLYGVAQYIMNQGDEEARTAARAVMINGIIALFVVISVWGLVAVLNTTFGIEEGGGPGGIPQGAF